MAAVLMPQASSQSRRASTSAVKLVKVRTAGPVVLWAGTAATSSRAPMSIPAAWGCWWGSIPPPLAGLEPQGVPERDLRWRFITGGAGVGSRRRATAVNKKDTLLNGVRPPPVREGACHQGSTRGGCGQAQRRNDRD